MTGPLSSLKVLDFSTLLPGPYGTMMLADMGAEVVCVEAISSGIEKRFVPMRQYLGRSKRSLAIDLKKPGSQNIIKSLIEHYDIIVEQFRPGVMDKLSLGYESLKKLNPKIIYCSLTGYGQTGPFKNRAGHDINYLATSGLSSYSGTKKEGPVLSGTQIADVGGGSLHTVVGLLAAFIHREKTGEGQKVDISMTDASFAFNSIHAANYFVAGMEPAMESTLLNGGSFYGYYETSDKRYFSVGSLEPKFFASMCEALGISPQSDSLEIEKAFKKKTYANWCEIFSKIDACVEPVLSFKEAVDHPQIKEREMVVDVPDGEKFQKQVGNPLKFSASKTKYKHIGGLPGNNTQEILLEVGLKQEEIDSLKKEGVVQ